MVIAGQPNAGEPGRTLYELGGFQTTVEHFVVRETLESNPFGPHEHEQTELWYIVEGDAVLVGDGSEQQVTGGDLIAIAPWETHGLRTDSRVVWICLG